MLGVRISTRHGECPEFIDNSLVPVTLVDMSEERATPTAKQQNKPHRWRPTKRHALWAAGLALLAAMSIACVVAIRMGHRLGYVPLVIVVLLTLIRLGYRYEWTGFSETSRPKDEMRDIQPRKTLWDWMQLLFVPVMLAILAGGLTWWQTSSERARLVEEAAHQEELRAQNTAVQDYLDQMTTLMLEDHLRNSVVNSEVRNIAQARTSAVLRAVEPENQRTLLQFLSDARLIQRVDENLPIISLDRVDLSDTDLRDIALSGADLRFADLRLADLPTDLSRADLRGVNLNGADLEGANLSNANLGTFFPHDGYPRGVKLSGANLSGANLSGAFLGDAGLYDANLSDANLSGAFLGNAHLTGADLSGADLSGADLRASVTEEQLEAAKTLEGATMPNGQKYEDWLKNKESGG
jgi:uncharacterized protein YjbI with pentapeptide repeats